MPFTICLKCNLPKQEAQIINLDQCGHEICRECLADHVTTSKGAEVCCPANCQKIILQTEIKSVLSEVDFEEFLQRGLLNVKKGKKTFNCPSPGCKIWVYYDSRVQEMTCESCEKTSCLSCKSQHFPKSCEDFEIELKEGNFKEDKGVLRLLQSIQAKRGDILLNKKEVYCCCCWDTFKPGEALLLKSCKDPICRECLVRYLVKNNSSRVCCPLQECRKEIDQSEIKCLLTRGQFDRYLDVAVQQTIREQPDSHFQCRTVNCPGACFYGPSVTEFQCEKCLQVNCISCEAIHYPQSCEDYHKSSEKDLSQESEASIRYIEKQQEAGNAMNCPRCRILLTKSEDECHWSRCNCGLEICWATLGPRWGPKGNGDKTGGCRCGDNGDKCTPSCTTCH